MLVVETFQKHNSVGDLAGKRRKNAASIISDCRLARSEAAQAQRRTYHNEHASHFSQRLRNTGEPAASFQPLLKSLHWSQLTTGTKFCNKVLRLVE